MPKHGQHDGKFKQMVVWNYLKELGGAAPKSVAALLEISDSATCRLLRRMVDRGSAEATGSTRQRIYTAGRILPKDMRGKHPQVVVNLSHGPQGSAVATAARKGRLYVPSAKHALDKAMRRACTSRG